MTRTEVTNDDWRELAYKFKLMVFDLLSECERLNKEIENPARELDIDFRKYTALGVRKIAMGATAELARRLERKEKEE